MSIMRFIAAGAIGLVLAAAIPPHMADARGAPPRSRYSVTIPLDAVQKGTPLPPIAGPAGKPLVMIDPGHGGHDPGATSSHDGRREKDVTLSIAQAMRDALLGTGRVRVALTRDDDHFIALADRYELGRTLKADLFISIHADSAGNPDASGATVYTLSETASDREAARLAERENRADILNGVNLGSTHNKAVNSILIDLSQRETMKASTAFAKLLHRETSATLPFRAIFHRFASLIVLKAPDMPSILFETGYLSNRRDAQFLNSPAGRSTIAAGTARAVETYFARRSLTAP